MLKESLKNFKEAEKDLMDIFKQEAVISNIESMDANTLNAVQSVFRFMDASTRLIEEQTLAIDSMNKKIDEILSRVRTD